jgi:ABC-2 type transport system ATP-binding protein
MIEVEHLFKVYGEFAAVRDISFTAEPGQVTGFLGPNGAGKTTTMRILTGFMPPTSGTARVAGFDVFERSLEVRRRVGYLPENVPLYRDMTARNYLMYIGEIRGIKNVRARADELLSRVGLSDRANSRIRTLSKGMKQRVGLAQALMHNPQVLILDEPTIGLDPLQVLELRQLVADLGRDHTVLFSTHILSEAEQVCDKVVIINAGEILAEGEPSELRARLQRGSRVLVRSDAPAPVLRDLITSVPGVKSVEITTDGVIATPTDADGDPRALISKAIIDRGLSLTEIRPLAVNLEEIFLEVTRRQASVITAESAPELVAVEAAAPTSDGEQE